MFLVFLYIVYLSIFYARRMVDGPAAATLANTLLFS